jgi:hypothetical protein
LTITLLSGLQLTDDHRLAQRCCPSIVKAFHYLWHPDARDTFDNHFGTSSRFSDIKEATWTTTITLSHWIFKPDLQLMFDEARINKGEFPPLNVKRPTPRADQDEIPDSRNIIEESCSSLAITGDQHGYFWICSAWSTLTTDKDFSKELEKLPRMLKIFLYQQASGRNLVFLLLLGHLCEKLQEKYKAVLWDLDQFVGLGVITLLLLPNTSTNFLDTAKSYDSRTRLEDRHGRPTRLYVLGSRGTPHPRC